MSLTRNAFGILQCPDCTALFDPVRRFLGHDTTSPLGMALDQDSAADRGALAGRPAGSSYRRPITPTEVVQLRAAHGLPDAVEIVGDVEVVAIADGIRVRRYGALAVRPRGGEAP